MSDTTQHEPTLGDNSAARYETIKDGFETLRRIARLKAKLDEKAEKVRATLEKEAGVNRGALGDIMRISKLAPSAIRKREESRSEMFALILQPKLDEAEAADADEDAAEDETREE